VKTMNCREAEPLLVDAARAGSRPETAPAVNHAASCAACGERLREERALSAALRSLAAPGDSQAPSAGCEAILMAAYRTERGREKKTRRWIFALSGAMAASVMMLLGTALLLSHESGKLVSLFTSRPSVGAGATQGETLSAANVDSSEEDVTDFVAFYPGADTGSVDNGALVRVRVPSSTLSSFGVHVGQAEQTDDEWVNADLLVGEDGSPVAIRFVRPTPQAGRD